MYLIEYLAFFVIASFFLASHYLKKRYRIIQVHTLPDFLVFAALLPKLLGARVILDMHEVAPEFFISKYDLSHSSFRIRLISWVETASARFADHVLTVSHSLKEIIASRGIMSSKIDVLMNVADDSLFNVEFYKDLETPISKVFRLMYHGSLIELYDLDVVLEAVHILRNRIPEIELRIFGKGPMLEHLKEQISILDLGEQVHISEWISHKGIPKEICSANVGIVPIRNDSYTDLALPTKLLEYIAMQRPTIVSRRKTIQSYFDDTCIMFFEPSNGEDLARAIEELYLDPGKASLLALNATEAYYPYRWEASKIRYCELVADLYYGKS